MSGEENLRNRFAKKILCLLFCVVLAGCVPTTAPEAQSGAGEGLPSNEPVLGCAAGGSGVFTPEDVRCYLDSFDPAFVMDIGVDTAVLFTDPNSMANWVGGAIIYHIPSVSSLVLDQFGDVDPQFSQINSRAALAAFNEQAANPQTMAFLKQTVQANWQTSDSGVPEVRLGLAWQDGINSVFMVSIAGLPAEDDRFFCPKQAWTIGEEEIVIIADCIVQDEDAFVPHLLFTSQEVRGSQPQAVQLALDGVASNVLQVAEGTISVETAVYQAAIRHITNQAVMLRNETITETENATTLASAIDPTLLDKFLAINQYSIPLDFLFHNSQTIFRQPSWIIARDYLPATAQAPDCTRFDQSYPGLRGGIIGLSQIGLAEDGRSALLFLQQECGETAVASSYLLLEIQDQNWVVIDEFGKVAVEAATPLMPELVYNGRIQGCGDIFMYKTNDDDLLSEFLTLSLPARSFALSEEPLTLELADYREEITVKIDLFGDRVYNFGEFPYCNDVGPEAQPQSVWLAQSGTLTISINGTVPPDSCLGDGYEATVRLQNVVFASGAETMQLDEAQFENVPVGWCAG